MSAIRTCALLLFVLATAGCSTSTWLKLPEQSTITINERSKEFSQGLVKTRPFFWDRASGVPYRLSDAQGEVLAEGTLRTRFRVGSIFWPPYAVIYWPMGFAQSCYDLSNETPDKCSKEDLYALKKAWRQQH